MFDEATDTPTVARTSNLNEELGQVSHCTCYDASFVSCRKLHGSKLQQFVISATFCAQWILWNYFTLEFPHCSYLHIL